MRVHPAKHTAQVGAEQLFFVGEQANSRKLHIGCGTVRKPDWINADLHKTDATDIEFDACMQWPYPESRFETVYGFHVWEHLPDICAFMQEAHRCLEDWGHLAMVMPFGWHDTAMTDPTHLRPWFPISFACWQPGYFDCGRNPQHRDIKTHFAVEIVQVLVPQWAGKLGHRFNDFFTKHFLNYASQLAVSMRAIKSPESYERYAQRPQPGNCVPLYYTSSWL